jgi:hypothetical protein
MRNLTSLILGALLLATGAVPALIIVSATGRSADLTGLEDLSGLWPER